VVDSRHFPEEEPTPKQATNTGSHQRGVAPGAFCGRCGAWRGELGLEPGPALYIEHIVEVFREVRRVLRSDGTLFLNLGDSYAGSWGAQGRRVTESDEPSWHSSQIKNHPKRASHTGTIRGFNLKPKDLMMMPARIALALQADGWWIRSEITWAKRAPMPESVRDRPTSATEKVFLLTKSERYFWDAVAVQEESVSDHDSGNGFKREARLSYADANGPRGNDQQWRASRPSVPKGRFGGKWADTDQPAFRAVMQKRNMRNWWLLGPEPYPDAHFAVFPSEIPRRAILAGTSEKGVCPACGAPWVRVVDKRRTRDGEPLTGSWPVNNGGQRIGASGVGHWRDRVETTEIGWSSSCSCPAADPVPATVLDCFAGSGTSLVVADRLGRNAVGVELNPTFTEMARKRLIKDAGLFAEVAD
jgi:DNA modification methylase